MFFMLLLKGFIIGIAFIIPGVSGGTLAIYLGIYDKLLHAIGHIVTETKKSIQFLVPVFLGVGLSVVLLAKILGYFIEKNSLVTLFFFIGLILGGIPYLFKQTKGAKIKPAHYIAFAVAFAIVILMLLYKLNYSSTGLETFPKTIGNFALIFMLGLIASTTMIIPGISGSALLMVLGFYTAIVTNVVGNLFDFSSFSYNLFVMIPFGLGAVVGIVVFSKVLETLLKKYKSETYYAIIGFIIASIIVIFFEIKDPTSSAIYDFQTPIYEDLGTYFVNNVFSFLLALVALVSGTFISLWNSKLELK
ncbi:MAG: DUF368 domain-containing protein [Candidatus Izemoplasmatales bacterium]